VVGGYGRGRPPTSEGRIRARLSSVRLYTMLDMDFLEPRKAEVRHRHGLDGPGSQFHSAYLPRILRKSEFLTKGALTRSSARPIGHKPRPMLLR
jgi:hypothetical protein